MLEASCPLIVALSRTRPAPVDDAYMRTLNDANLIFSRNNRYRTGMKDGQDEEKSTVGPGLTGNGHRTVPGHSARSFERVVLDAYRPISSSNVYNQQKTPLDFAIAV